MTRSIYSFCRQCGETVIWPKKEDGKTSRPVEYVDAGFTITDNVISYTSTNVYKFHHCDPVKIEAFAEESAVQAAQIKEYSEKLREAQIEGLKRKCRKCGAKINEACVNLTERKKGNTVKIKWPHPERLPHVQKTENSSDGK